MFYYPEVNQIKNKFKGYSPKSFSNKDEFYNYVGSYLFNLYRKNPVIQYITENYVDWDNAFETQSFTENMLCEGYQLWGDIKHPSIIWIGSENVGDGNPMEMIYCILDDTTKEYTLVSASGYYSSWDYDEFNSFDQVTYQEVTVASFPTVKYGV